MSMIHTFFISNSESITRHEKCDRFDQKFEKTRVARDHKFLKVIQKKSVGRIIEKMVL